MQGLAGFRSVYVLTNVTTGTLGTQYKYLEVTNNTASDIIFYVNDYPGGGHPTVNDPYQGIPIKAGSTREIPMAVGNFTASGNVTVVAYAQ